MNKQPLTPDETTLRESEAIYRKLFENMTEMFQVLEPILDDQGKTVDFRYIEVNPASENLVGRKREAIVGKTARQLWSVVEDYWLDMLDTVLQTGQPVRMENYSRELDAYYDLKAWKLDDRRVAILFSNITGRKRIELNLALLADISQFLTITTSEREIIETSAQRIGEYFQVAHCMLAELDRDAETMQVLYDWRRDPVARNLTGAYRMEVFGTPDTYRKLVKGKPIVTGDVAREEHANVETFQAHDVTSGINAPFVSDGVLRASIIINQPTTRHWRQDEIDLLQELTRRIWTRIVQSRSETALRLRESEVRALVENSQDFIVRLDRQARQIYANPATARLYGLPLQEFLGKNLREMGFPEDVWRPALKTCDQVFATGQTITLEQIHPFGGTARYFEARHVPEFDTHGHVATVLVVTREITERKLEEKEFARVKARLEHLLSASPVVIYSSKIDGDFGATYMSSNVTRQLGYAPQDFLNNNGFWAEHIHPDDAPRVFAELPRVFEAGTHSHEYRFRHQDGTWRWMLEDLHLVRDRHGNPQEIIGAWTDITDRKQTETVLRENEARLQLALEGGEIGTWDWDLATDHAVWDEREHRLFGFTPGTFDGRGETALQRIHPEDREHVSLSISRAVHDTRPYRDEFRVVQKDGSVRWLASRAVPIPNEHGKITRIIGVNFDITPRKEAEQAREHRHEEELARLYRIGTVNELAGGLAHELSQPLTAIQNYVGSCVKWVKGGGLANQLLSPLQAINEQSQRVVDIIQHLRRLMVTGEPQRAFADITMLVTRARDLLKVPLARKNVKFTIEAEPALPAVYVDALQIEQVLIILIRNSIDAFTGDHLKQPAIQVRLIRHYAAVMVEVSDNGPGVSPEQLARLFQPFYTTKAHGTGLGLMLAHSLIESHQGIIRALPSVSLGLTVQFTLPIGDKTHG